MKYYKKILLYLLMIGVTAYVVVGCTKGKYEALPIVQTKTVEVNVTLPDNTPLEREHASLYLLGERYQPDDDGMVTIEVPINKVFDLSLMLPAREGETEPTVYLSSMIVPGEIHIDLNTSEAAVSLLMEGLDQTLFTESTTALFVKETLRREGQEFIAYFITEIEKDPYLMRLDNLREFLLANTLYIDTLTRVNTILSNTFDTTITPSVQRTASATALVKSISNSSESGTVYDGGGVKISPVSLQDMFTIYAEYDEYGHYTGDLTLWNGSFLPSLYRMTDTMSGEVLKETPTGLLETAFSQDILAGYSLIFNILLPNYTTVESGAKNVLLEVYTPGFKDYDTGIYLEEGSPSVALLMRSGYSYAFIPALSIVLPSGKWYTEVFDILQKAGVFEDLVSYWSRGDITGGLEQMCTRFEGMPKAALYHVLEEAVESPTVVLSIIGKKVITSEISLAAAGVATQQLKLGLQNTASKIVFYVNFPLGLKDIQPPAAIKVDSAEAVPRFVLRGHGFKSFTFNDVLYAPSLDIKVYDVDDTEMYAFTLESAALDISSDGREITFELPRYVVQKDTKVSYAEIKLNHAYVDVGFLGSYFDYFNELKSVTLPVTAEEQERMRIYLSSELIVSSVDKETYTIDMDMLLRGEGFHSQSSGLENKVFFVDENNDSVQATVIESWDDMITLKTPAYLGLEYKSIGKGSLYVELTDGSKSNPYPVDFVPLPPTADVYDETGEASVLYKGQEITLKQKDNVDIYYSLNGSSMQHYEGPLRITESSTIFAYAEYEGITTRYRSPLAMFDYKTCAEGETYIDYPHGAKCEVIRNGELMVPRYCPLNSIDYQAPFYVNIASTTPMEVSCSYYYGYSSLQYETHVISVYHPETGTSSREMVASTLYWQEPRGRPMAVTYPEGEYYEFCPNGSFYPEIGSCEKD